jgi:hypothetical protein
MIKLNQNMFKMMRQLKMEGIIEAESEDASSSFSAIQNSWISPKKSSCM